MACPGSGPAAVECKPRAQQVSSTHDQFEAKGQMSLLVMGNHRGREKSRVYAFRPSGP